MGQGQPVEANQPTPFLDWLVLPFLVCKVWTKPYLFPGHHSPEMLIKAPEVDRIEESIFRGKTRREREREREPHREEERNVQKP
jgi:hypothetical protein